MMKKIAAVFGLVVLAAVVYAGSFTLATPKSAGVVWAGATFEDNPARWGRDWDGSNLVFSVDVQGVTTNGHTVYSVYLDKASGYADVRQVQFTLVELNGYVATNGWKLGLEKLVKAKLVAALQ